MAKQTGAELLDKALALFQTGKSLRECEKATGINFKKIEREAKKRGIEKGSVTQLVSDMVRVREEFDTLPVTTQDVVTKTVDEKLAHIKFFNDAAVKNVKEAMKTPCENHQEFKFRAETILKGKEVVLGKTPEISVDIHNTNAQANMVKDLPSNPLDAAKVYQDVIGK